MAPAPDIILFTYKISVFGRRMDWYLVLRGIKYFHCPQRNRLPREDLEALGIHYRRIPILAIGRDIYCDTRLIIEKLEQLFPQGRLGSTDPAQRGIEKLLETWVIDGGPFWRTAQLIPTSAPHMSDQKWLDDRHEMSGKRFTKEAVDESRSEALVNARMNFALMENSTLADGRKWLLNGPEPSLAEIHAGWVFDWLLEPYMKEALEASVISESIYPKTFAWLGRILEATQAAAEKHGKPQDLTGKDAIEKILSADFFEKEGDIDPADPLLLRKGEEVEVWPTDSGFNHHDRGELVSIGVSEIVIASKPKTGNCVLRLHFPRTNFRIRAVSQPASHI